MSRTIDGQADGVGAIAHGQPSAAPLPVSRAVTPATKVLDQRPQRPRRVVYVTQTGDLGPDPDPATWRVWRIASDGSASILVEGAPLHQPNGIGLDSQGAIVVVNYGNADVLTFSVTGELLKTEHAVQAGGDGLVIMPDGRKCVSSVSQGGVSRIRPGEPAELIARNIPSAASMCHDAGADQLVIPMGPNHGPAFVPLR